MEFVVRGGLDGGPSLRLDHERFAYAGKFVTGRTGKALAREGEHIVAVASFDRDRTDPTTARVRYVTVRDDRRGEGVGARLLAFVAAWVLQRVDRVRIAVNNPFAYEAAYKAGFGYEGVQTGLAEVVLVRPADRTTSAYRAGLSAIAEREDLRDDEAAFVADRERASPPPTVEPPTDA